MRPLNPFNINLEKTTLIEASAGTGKTYTITTLYTRLVAIGYSVESILVVTFTEAAAAELKLRIRHRLFHVLESLQDPSLSGDDDLTAFLNRKGDIKKICQRLKLALVCFDQAAIMTIHSFCLKILKENAFESRTLFDIELVPDRSVFVRQVSYDFFMGHVNNLDPLFLSYLAQKHVTPEWFADYFGPLVSRPRLKIIPESQGFLFFFDEYREILQEIKRILCTEKEEILALIADHKGIYKQSYSKRNVPVWLNASLKKINENGPNTLFKMTEKGDALFKFTQSRIAGKTKSGYDPPKHQLFNLCEQLIAFHDKFERNLIHLKIKFLRFFKLELKKIKKTNGIYFFDDLINELAAVLEEEQAPHQKKDPSEMGSHHLITSVRARYKTCLIDEFQDTDPLQYHIFSTLFSQKHTPFFMIGDPKQAIYSFRGGDIFAYLKASKECEQTFTLEKNYRSSPLMVNGVNAVFSIKENPFLFKTIDFLPVATPLTAKNYLIENNKFVPPLQFCFVNREGQLADKQKFISKDTAAHEIPKIISSDIISLVNSPKRLIDKDSGKERKISFNDIAVLVRTNRQAEQVQNELLKAGIPSYLSKTGSVFESGEAVDLYHVLWAVSHPHDKGYIFAALCTRIFNFKSDEILALETDDLSFFEWQERFIEYKEIWDAKGFVPMMMALFHSKKAFLKPTLHLNERSLTNFYHLAELISQETLKKQLSSYYVLKWYTQQLSNDFRDEFADELRLESDKKAVSIITIHKSKGLEYPIVYLPYLWEGTEKRSQENIVFHDPDKGDQLTLDIGSEKIDAAYEYAAKEERAEQRRLLYVAMTRATAMCRIVWGGFKSIEMSALGSILHVNGCKDDQKMIKDLAQLRALEKNSISIEMNKFERAAQCQPGELNHTVDLSARKTTRDIKPAWKMSSFTAITHIPDPGIVSSKKNHDEKDQNKGNGQITLAQFPRGAGSGDFFHAVFEALDFRQGPETIKSLVTSKSDMAGPLNPEMIKVAQHSITQVLETKLEGPASGFCLKDIGPRQRFNELEFFFPVNSFDKSTLINVFEQSNHLFKEKGYIDKISKLSAAFIKGFIKGFIDLIVHHENKWYIIDYKSNYLGDTYQSYSGDAMFDAMADHHYFLQYYIYLVALHRYLKLRLKDYDYETHFGGVFYLFIRGMHPEFGSKFGVFYDRPLVSAISCLSDNL